MRWFSQLIGHWHTAFASKPAPTVDARVVEAKQSRGGLTADLILRAEPNSMWELACLRWHQLVVPDTPRCLHRRQASSHRKAKQHGAGGLYPVKLWERACSRMRWF